MVRVIPPYPNFDVNDPNIAEAINFIFNEYGDNVSVVEKAKPLNKFGRNLSVATAFETVSEFQGSEINETFVSTDLIDSISSSNSADQSKTVTIEGHTIDGSGNLTFVSQDATTDASDGQTKVTLTTPLARANRLYIKNSGTFNSPQTALAGTLFVYDDAGGVGSGTPTVPAATKLLLTAGETQSEKSATSISSQDYWIITQMTAGVGSNPGNAAEIVVRMEMRDVFNGGVWRPMGRDIVLIVAAQNPTPFDFAPYRVVPKNHDWRIRAVCDANTAPVFAEASGYLALVV